MDQEENKEISFDLPKNRSNVIKVIGVGGGGSNAINYMFQQGIKGVDFIISNTDAQALSESGVPTKIQLGASLTEGLGAGANPEIGAKAAEESHDEIHSILSTQTKMIFITAGMGGGTGTGAAPIIAQMAKSMDILTVGIVTMPFQFEGRLRQEQAQKGLEKIKAAVDALIVINNNKLREVSGNLGFKAGFAKADEVLATAARGIAEVITHHYTQNIDLKDAKTVLTNSGTAIMGSGTASGSNRAQEAIVKALDSPLLNDNKITGCKNVLLLIVSGSEEITIDEIGEINDFIQTEAGNHTNIIMGVGEDESLGNEISVTVIATGFGLEQQNEISNTEAKKIIHSLEDEQRIEHDLSDGVADPIKPIFDQSELQSKTSIFESSNQVEKENPLIEMNALLRELNVDFEVVPYPEKIKEEAEEEIQFSASLIPNDIPTENFATTEDFVSQIKENTNSFSDQENGIESDEELFSTSPDLVLTPSFFEEVDESDLPDNSDDESETDFQITKQETEFIFNEIEVKDHLDIEVTDPEIVSADSQIEMEFDAPLPTKDSDRQRLSLGNELGIELEQEKTVTDFDSAALEIKFEVQNTTEKSSSKAENGDLKQKGLEDEVTYQEDDPFNRTIDQTLEAQNKKRKEHLKAFNHKFMHQMQRVDDLEKQPAYKRQGLDLDHKVSETPSRLTLDTDENNDLQIRSNNSFLHDNVD